MDPKNGKIIHAMHSSKHTDDPSLDDDCRELDEFRQSHGLRFVRECPSSPWPTSACDNISLAIQFYGSFGETEKRSSKWDLAWDLYDQGENSVGGN